MAGIISLILWFALLGSLAWFVTSRIRALIADPDFLMPREEYGDWPALPDALGHNGGRL